MPNESGNEPLRVVVLASGSGTNLRALVRACAEGRCSARVVAVVSDKPEAPALTFAAHEGIATAVVPWRGRSDRAAWDEQLARTAQAHEPQLIVLAGFMRIVGKPLLAAAPGRIINVHPSLLPCFAGKDAADQAVKASVRISGCTVHVVDEGVDTGPILAQCAVPVLPADDASALHRRIQQAEHRLLPEVVHWIATGRVELGPPLRFMPPGEPSGPASVLQSPSFLPDE